MANTRKLVNKPGQTIPIKPAAALASPYRFVTFDTDSMSVVLAGAYDDSIGVVYNAYAAAELGEAIVDGIVLVELGDTVAPGGYVEAGALGVANPVTSTHPRLGRCIVGGVVGELGSIMLLNKSSVA